MKISIASDHGGITLKKDLINYLNELNYESIDLSPINQESDDYPDFAEYVCQNILAKESKLGILICRSGIGMSIAANKFKGIYCGKIISEKEAIIAKEHNGINVISLDGNTPIDEAQKIIKAFIETPQLNDERHIRRYNKIIKIETGEYNDL